MDLFSRNFRRVIFWGAPCRWHQGWAGMTFGSLGIGTGMDNSNPEVREREGNGKNPFPKLGSRKGMKKTYSKNSGTGRALKRSIPKIREWEGNDKIHSHILGTGIGGYHSQEEPGTWTKIERKNKWYDNMMKYFKNDWREKDFWPQIFPTTSSSFFDNPPSFCRYHSHYQQKMILFTITGTPLQHNNL